MTFAAYYPALRHPFVNYDDDTYITQNRHVQQGLSLDTAAWALTSRDAGNWHPLTWLSHALDYDLFGLDAWGHHLTSVLLHALNAGLLFLLLSGATGMRGRSFVVAALFALHPINVESVAWAAERKTVLCMLLFLLAVGAYGWYARKPGVLRYLSVFALSALALSSKPMAVTLPFVFLLLDFWPLSRMTRPNGGSQTSNGTPYRNLVAEKIPFFLLTIASSVITLIAQRRALKTVAAVSLGARVANAIFSYVMYLWKAVWPVHLGVFYAHRGSQLALWQTVLCLLFLAAVTVLVWRIRNRSYLLFGWLWYLGTLVPMIGIVQAGEQGMADRYAYLPFLGIFTMVVWGLADIPSSRQIDFKFSAVLAALVLVALAVLTRHQLTFWDSSFAMWSHSLEVTSENYVAEDFVGSTLLEEAYQKSGESCADSALQHFERAVRINPQDSVGHLNVGFCRQARGRLQDALAEYTAALRSAPNKYLRSRALLNLGAIHDTLGNFQTSREFLQQALQLYPGDPDIRSGLAQLEGDEKIATLSAQARNHTSAEEYLQLGRLQQSMGHPQDARVSYEKALALDPKSIEAKSALVELEKPKH